MTDVVLEMSINVHCFYVSIISLFKMAFSLKTLQFSFYNSYLHCLY